MYHYNPKTGEVSKCKAKSPETCPFGAENHAQSLEEITKFADEQNEELAERREFEEVKSELDNYFKDPENAKWLSGELPYDESKEVEVSGGKKMALKQVGEYLDNKLEQGPDGTYTIELSELKELFSDEDWQKFREEHMQHGFKIGYKSYEEMEDKGAYATIVRPWDKGIGRSECFGGDPEMGSLADRAYQYVLSDDYGDPEELENMYVALRRQEADETAEDDEFPDIFRCDNIPPTHIFYSIDY